MSNKLQSAESGPDKYINEGNVSAESNREEDLSRKMNSQQDVSRGSGRVFSGFGI